MLVEFSVLSFVNAPGTPKLQASLSSSAPMRYSLPRTSVIVFDAGTNDNPVISGTANNASFDAAVFPYPAAAKNNNLAMFRLS